MQRKLAICQVPDQMRLFGAQPQLAIPLLVTAPCPYCQGCLRMLLEVSRFPSRRFGKERLHSLSLFTHPWTSLPTGDAHQVLVREGEYASDSRHSVVERDPTQRA